MKKSMLLAAVSAFGIVAGLASQPASATDWGRICDNCGVDWHFTNHDIDLTIDPDQFELSAISSVCADQLFVGSLVSTAVASNINSGDFTNAASSVANVISVAGDSAKSPFGGVVDAVQKAYGSFSATANVTGATVYGTTGNVKNALSNTATAAANVISLDVTEIAFVDATQKTGDWWAPATLNSAANATNVNMISGGDFDNVASSVANVVSINVSPAVGNGGGNQNLKPLSYTHPPKPELPNLTSLALVDVQQTTFANMTSLANATNINTSGGAFNNAATSAANVVSIINKK
ncbi:MAG: hypothetical protein ACM3Q1_01135 [Bacteroidales bacterium]